MFNVDITARRYKHEPIQYILGEWKFRNIHLNMRRPVLIPRPETGQLVSIALELYSYIIFNNLKFEKDLTKIKIDLLLLMWVADVVQFRSLF